MSLAQQQELENNYIMHTYARKPVMFTRGEGLYLYDDEGKRYLDFLSGIGAVSVGHGNPAVASEIALQASRLIHVSNYFYIEGRGELAARINGLLCASEASKNTVWKTFFANSGAEANEGAIKIARKYGKEKLGGAHTIITAKQSFHGRTLATLAATGQEAKQKIFAPMPAGFVHVTLNNVEELRACIDSLNEASGASAPCALMLECIQGERGVWPCTLEYLTAARKLTRECGMLLIIDEVQTGFFRTGKYPFAFMHFGICPDVVTMAKGIANGVPMGAVAARDSLADVLAPGEHGTTFGGSPLAIAAANATIDELIERDTATRVTQLGAYFALGLSRLPKVSELRGKGFMLAIQLTEPIAVAVVETALQQGLICNAIGEETIRFLPPLVATDEDIDEALAILKGVLEGISAPPISGPSISGSSEVG